MGIVTPPILHNNSASVLIRLSSLQKLLNLGLDLFGNQGRPNRLKIWSVCLFFPKGAFLRGKEKLR